MAPNSDRSAGTKALMRIRQQGMTAQAVMLRVRTIAQQAGVDPVTPNDLRLTYLTELERQRLDARTKGRPEGLLALEMLPVPYRAPQFDRQASGGWTTRRFRRQKRGLSEVPHSRRLAATRRLLVWNQPYATAAYHETARLYRRCREGETVRRPIDCLIAGAAISGTDVPGATRRLIRRADSSHRTR